MTTNSPTPGPGHNSTIAGDRLQSFIERIERLEEEKSALSDDISEVKKEAKSVGFDVKTINKIVKMRKMDESQRAEEQELLDLYMNALGMLADTPLGDAAIKKATAT